MTKFEQRVVEELEMMNHLLAQIAGALFLKTEDPTKPSVRKNVYDRLVELFNRR